MCLHEQYVGCFWEKQVVWAMCHKDGQSQVTESLSMATIFGEATCLCTRNSISGYMVKL